MSKKEIIRFKICLKFIKIDYQFFDDQIVFKPGTLLTGQGKPFSVFTPFKKKWIENFSIDHLEIESEYLLKKILMLLIHLMMKSLSFKIIM